MSKKGEKQAEEGAVAEDELPETADLNEGGRLGAAREKVKTIAADARDRYDRMSEGVKRGAEKAGAVARERYSQISEKAKHGYQKARKDVDDLTENVNEYVRDNPGKSVLIAASVGFVIGILVRGAARRGRD